MAKHVPVTPGAGDVTAIVLSGGMGTRLRSVLPDLPKSLAPVQGRAFIDHVLDGLSAQGIRQVVLATGFKAQAVEEHCGDGSRWGVTITYSREDEPLGTGGAIRLAEPLCEGDPVLAMNGDSLVQLNLEQMLAEHTASGTAVTVAVCRVHDKRRFGSVDVADDGRVLGFSEKGEAGTGWVNAGVYAIDRRTLRDLPTGNLSMEHDVLPQLASSGRVTAFKLSGDLLDIGTPESLARSQRDPLPGTDGR